MKSAFDETGKTKEVIDRNYGFIDNKGAPPIKYVKSWVYLCVFAGEGSCLRPEMKSLSALWLTLLQQLVPALTFCRRTSLNRTGKLLLLLPSVINISVLLSTDFFFLLLIHTILDATTLKMASRQKSSAHFKNLHMRKWAGSFVRRDLRFIEVIENVCQRLLEYNLHKEREGSNRFAKVRLCVWSKVGFSVLKWAGLC